MDRLNITYYRILRTQLTVIPTHAPHPRIGLVSHIFTSYTISVLVAFICILKKYKSQRPQVLEFSLTQPLCAFLPISKQDIGLGDFSCIYGEMTEISGSLRESESDQVSVT